MIAACWRFGTGACVADRIALTFNEDRMRATLFGALAIAAVLSGGVFDGRAEAMTRAAPSTLRAVAARTALVQRVATVCGTNGCVKVQTHRIVHHKPGAIGANHI
jgi:hypothetical protein